MSAISNKKLPKTINLNEEYTNNFIFCHAGQETAIETLHSYKGIDFEKSFSVEYSESVVKFVQNNYGVGIISDFVLSNEKFIYKANINPKIEIGMIDTNFSSLSPAAIKMKEIIEDSIDFL